MVDLKLLLLGFMSSKNFSAWLVDPRFSSRHGSVTHQVVSWCFVFASLFSASRKPMQDKYRVDVARHGGGIFSHAARPRTIVDPSCLPVALFPPRSVWCFACLCRSHNLIKDGLGMTATFEAISGMGHSGEVFRR